MNMQLPKPIFELQLVKKTDNLIVVY